MAYAFAPTLPRPRRPRPLTTLVSGGWWARHAALRSVIATLTIVAYSSLTLAAPVLGGTASTPPVPVATEARQAGGGWLRGLGVVVAGLLGGSAAHAQIVLQPPFTTDYRLTDLGAVPGLPLGSGQVLLRPRAQRPDQQQGLWG